LEKTKGSAAVAGLAHFSRSWKKGQLLTQNRFAEARAVRLQHRTAQKPAQSETTVSTPARTGLVLRSRLTGISLISLNYRIFADHTIGMKGSAIAMAIVVRRMP
jgi:hypothetical protein